MRFCGIYRDKFPSELRYMSLRYIPGQPPRNFGTRSLRYIGWGQAPSPPNSASPVYERYIQYSPGEAVRNFGIYQSNSPLRTSVYIPGQIPSELRYTPVQIPPPNSTTPFVSFLIVVSLLLCWGLGRLATAGLRPARRSPLPPLHPPSPPVPGTV